MASCKMHSIIDFELTRDMRQASELFLGSMGKLHAIWSISSLE